MSDWMDQNAPNARLHQKSKGHQKSLESNGLSWLIMVYHHLPQQNYATLGLTKKSWELDLPSQAVLVGVRLAMSGTS